MTNRIRINIFSSLLIQVLTVISGLILPKLILSSFGSEVNGLVSSITQFLSFISLLEGGLGAVVLAELYKPIEEKNINKINIIVNIAEKFFKKIGFIFIIYTLCLCITYPFFVESHFSFGYISTLIFILSLNLFIQYFYSITYRLLLQANQEIYVVNFTTCICIILNIVLTLIVIKIYPNIHMVKLLSSLIYIIQPIIYKKYVSKCVTLNKKINDKESNILKNRWSGFAQNLAYFINMNTDITIISIFLNLKEVSVYSVYMLVLNGLRTLVTCISNTYQTMLGKYLASENMNILKEKFFNFEFIMWNISNVIFGTCLLLINPFIMMYTSNVSDVNYYRFSFSIIMTIAQLLFCAEDSYRMLILAAGHFKETNLGSILEAIINIMLSLILIQFFGITGVAIGTLMAYIFKIIYYIYYLRKNIIFMNYRYFFKNISTSCLLIIINMCIIYNIHIKVNSFISFIVIGLLIVIFEFLLTVIINLLLNKKYIISIFKHMRSKYVLK